MELLRGSEPLNAVLVALGNGAMLTGIGRWVKAYAPQTGIIGVCADGDSSMAESWREGRIIEKSGIDTIADGIGIRIPISEVLEDMRGTVDDETIIKAMKLLHRQLGLVVEPSGAVGLAAILSEPARFKDKLVAIVICGGNLTIEQMDKWLK